MRACLGTCMEKNGNHAVMRERPNDGPHELLVTRSSMAASRLVRGHRPADPGWASACNGAKGVGLLSRPVEAFFGPAWTELGQLWALMLGLSPAK